MFPRVDEHRRAEVGGALQERDELGVVEVARADVVADVHAGVSARHRALELGARRVDVLQRHLAQRAEAPAAARAHLERRVVEVARHVDRRRRRPLPLEEDRRRADDLHVDAGGVEVVEPRRRVPAGARHRPEVAAARHEHRVARAPVPKRARRELAAVPHRRPSGAAVPRRKVGPRLGEEVGVHVDDGSELARRGGRSPPTEPAHRHLAG